MTEPQLPSKTKWVIVLSGAACMAVMFAVIVLAKTHAEDPAEPEAAPARTTVAGRGDGGETRSRPPEPDATALCGPLDPDKPPQIELDLPAKGLDLGTLKQGVRIEREVGFRNTGTGPLCVMRVTSGCGCLKATLTGDTKRFEPGDAGSIRMKIDTTGREGHVGKRVTVTSNDPKNPALSFKVDMDINAGLMLNPRYIDFGNQPPSTSVTREIFLRSPLDEPEWEVLTVEGGRRLLGAERVDYTFQVTPVEDPKFRKVKVTITHPGSERMGPFRDPLVVSTTHPERSRVIVQSSINIVPRIRCRSRIISLGFVRSGTVRPPTRARIQAGVPDLDFEITGVEVVPLAGEPSPAGGTGFKASYGKDERGWWVDVAYDGLSRKPGMLNAELVVQTDDGLQPELRVRIRATVQNPR